jgi:hypothetical protein
MRQRSSVSSCLKDGQVPTKRPTDEIKSELWEEATRIPTVREYCTCEQVPLHEHISVSRGNNQLHEAESFLEANSSSDSQEISRTLWEMEVHCRVHNRPSISSILNLINPVNA